MSHWSFKALDIMFQMNLNFHLTLIHWKGLLGLYAYIQKGETKIWNKVSSPTQHMIFTFCEKHSHGMFTCEILQKNSN